jgi:cystathionine beta-lyase/cystathionine gamma-synthase
MKLHNLTTLTTGLLLAVGINTNISQSAVAQSSTYFCKNNRSNQPTTYYLTDTGSKKPVIVWAKHMGGISPQERCQQVSSKFQAAYSQGVLNYLTPGFKNGSKIICASRAYGGNCDMMLFTLTKEQNPQDVIEDLMNVRASYPIVQGTSSTQPYYSIQELIDNAPNEE